MTTGTQAPDQLFGYDVMDSGGNKLGAVDGVWVDDATSALEFVSVKIGRIMGKAHLIPMANAQIQDGSIQVPYSEDQVKNAPGFGTDAELSPSDEDEIYSNYGIDRSTAPSPTGLPSGGPGMRGVGEDQTTQDQANVQLAEEELQVGKREVEAGRVRIRKVVRTEQVEQPVELRREEVQIERVDATGATVPDDAFQERDIEVPVMREEPVVSKEAQVTGEVRVGKTTETEQRSVGGEVRKEAVGVDKDADTDLGPRDRRQNR